MRVRETKRPRDRRTVEAQLLSFQEAQVKESFWERFWLHSPCVLIKPLRYPDVLLLSVCARIIWNTQEGKQNHPSSVESGDKTWEGCWIPKKWIFLVVVVQWKFQNSTAFRLWHDDHSLSYPDLRWKQGEERGNSKSPKEGGLRLWTKTV